MTEKIEYKCFKCKWQYELYNGTNCMRCKANSNFEPLYKEDND